MKQRCGQVKEIFSATKESSGMPRPKVEKLNLIKDFGIENDKFAGKDLDRTVMIIGLNSYNLAKENDISLEYGSYGENILLDFDPHTLAFGTILQIGDAQIQITQKCTICNHLAVFGKDLPHLAKDCRGLYCKVLESGVVLRNMEVTILDKGE